MEKATSTDRAGGAAAAARLLVELIELRASHGHGVLDILDILDILVDSRSRSAPVAGARGARPESGLASLAGASVNVPSGATGAWFVPRAATGRRALLGVARAAFIVQGLATARA